LGIRFIFEGGSLVYILGERSGGDLATLEGGGIIFGVGNHVRSENYFMKRTHGERHLEERLIFGQRKSSWKDSCGKNLERCEHGTGLVL